MFNLSLRSYTAARTSSKGSQQRLRDIQDALSGTQVASQPLPSQTQTFRPLTGQEKRLKDIEDALSWQEIPSQTCTFQSQTPRPLTGREKRIKDIEDALSGKDVPFGDTQMSDASARNSSLKRALCSTPEPEPPAKRRQLSPESTLSSPLQSPAISSFEFLPASPTTSITTTTETLESRSSPTPELIVTEEDVRAFTTYSIRSSADSSYHRFNIILLYDSDRHRTLILILTNSSAGIQTFISIPQRPW